MKVFKRITSFFMACVIIIGVLNTLPYNLIDVLATDDKSLFNEKTSCTYVWHLEPSVEADDIYAVDTDKEYVDKALIKNLTSGFVHHGGYDVYTNVVFRIGGTVGIMNYSGEILENNIGHNFIYTQNETIDVGYFWKTGWPGDPILYYTYDKDSQTLSDYYGNEYNGMDAVLVAEHDQNWNYSYGLMRCGEIIKPISYENGKMNFASNNGIAALYKEGKWGYFDSNGNQIIDFVCESTSYVPDSILGCYITGRGVDETGASINEITHAPYDIFMSTCGYIPVKINGECGYYDTKGNEVIPVGTFEEVRPVHNNLAWVKDKNTGLWGVIEIVQDKPNWRQLYAEKLRDYIASNDYSNDVKFDLYDLNDDNIPELIISEGTYHMARCYIYTVNEEKVLELGNYGQFGLVNFIEEKNLLYVGCNQGHSFVDFYRVKKDSVDLIFEAYTSELGQILGHDDAEYIVNGVPSTKEAYESGIELYYDSYKVKGDIGRQFELDENTIVKVFETMYSNNNSNYQVFDIGCSWTQAKEICEALGGNLVSINTKEEQSFIEEILESQIKDNYWIGGYRSGDTWRWCDGTGISYTNWDSWTGYDGEIHSQPDNYTGDENYIRIASRYIEYSDWLVNAGKWIDTANTADGISSGEAGLRTFGFVCEWEQPIDPFVKAHLDFIEENPDAFVNAEDIYLLAETKKLMYEYDSEITTYNGLKSIQNLISGDMDTDTFNAELTAQAILTDLLCSQETLNAMDTATKKAEDAFLIQALDVFLKNASVFKIDGIALAELTVLCETDDKSSAEYAKKCKEWIYKFVPTVEIELLSMYFDVTGKSGENLLLNVGVGVIETSEKYMDFCIAVKGYNAADACLREAMNDLLASLLVEYYMVKDELDAESIRIKSVVDQFLKQYLSVINTADSKYDEYTTDLITHLATNTATQAAAAIAKELLLTATKIACPTLGAVLEAMDLAFSIGMNVWEILSNVDERALERDMFLNMLVYYDAIVNAMNDTFKDRLITEKTLDSVYTYEEGLGFYKKITAMMVNHGTQYYSMLYEKISKMRYTKDEFYKMEEYVEGMFGTAYVEKMLAILEKHQGLFVDDEELEKRLELELGYVKSDLLNEITNRKFSLKLHEVDAIAMNCHESFIGPSQEIKAFDYDVYHIFCPVNLTIKNGNIIIAEVTEDVITRHDKTAPVSINVIKEEDDIYASKFVVVPAGYDVEITGYADGSMRYEKLIVKNGDVMCISTISNIPVKNGSIYREITEADKVVALECDLDNDGLVEQVVYAQENETTTSTTTASTTKATTSTTTTSTAITATTTTLEGIEYNYIYGDVNLDYMVNKDDEKMLASYLSNEIVIPAAGLFNADVNRDDEISDADLIILNMFINNWICVLPYTGEIPEVIITTSPTTMTTTTTTTTTTSTTTITITTTLITKPSMTTEITQVQASGELINKANKILEETGTTPINIYNFVCRNNVYRHIEETRSLDQIESKGWDYFANYAMNNRYVVQYYFAAITELLFQCAGYESRIVYGTGRGTGDHYWNQILIDGEWINYDACNGYYEVDDDYLKKQNYTFKEYLYPRFVPTKEPAYLLGDVNKDGSVDSSDASLVLAEYAKIQTGGAGEFTETQQKAADVNNDGVVDSSDASKILAYYAMVSIGKEPIWE